MMSLFLPTDWKPAIRTFRIIVTDRPPDEERGFAQRFSVFSSTASRRKQSLGVVSLCWH